MGGYAIPPTERAPVFYVDAPLAIRVTVDLPDVLRDAIWAGSTVRMNGWYGSAVVTEDADGIPGALVYFPGVEAHELETQG